MNRWIDELMVRYATYGLNQWTNDANDDLRGRASQILDKRIVSSEWELHSVFRAIRSSRLCDPPLLIPTPKPKDQIEQAFFLPLFRSWDQSGPRLSFDLFLMVKGHKCIAYRWEPAEDGTHGYGHVQMCQSLVNRTLRVSVIPEWVPDSYPAIPLLTSEPLGISWQ